MPTGALLSTVSFNEGQSIPGICHGVVLEHAEKCLDKHIIKGSLSTPCLKLFPFANIGISSIIDEIGKIPIIPGSIFI